MSVIDRPWSRDNASSGNAGNAAPTTSGSSGKQYRMGRLFAGDGRTVILPADHGLMLGRVPGLEDPVELVRRFLPLACDGFLLGPGLIQRTAPWFAHRGAPARLLTLDTYWRGAETGVSVLTTSLARAASLGVDGVKLLMPWDVPPEERAARAALIGQVVTASEELGLPVMVEPICLESPRGKEAVAIEADGCRMAAELGADIIKVAYPGDAQTFGRWCAELGVPVVILGGPAGGSVDELCDTVAEAVAAGARGVTIGRKLWQRPTGEATDVLARLAAIVHAAPLA